VVRAELELDEVLLPERAARAKDIADRKEGDPRRGDAAGIEHSHGKGAGGAKAHGGGGALGRRRV
jgi:hypothetical protein